MIWTVFSPFYDLFEKLSNGKVYTGIAEEIKSYVGKNDVVLECACGTGVLTVPMAKICSQLTATDVSSGMLRNVKKKLKNYKNVKIEKTSILDLPYAENTFDTVVAANVIHLLDEPEKAMQQLIRVCKAGGKIIIPTYIGNQTNKSRFFTKMISFLGVRFKRVFTEGTYKEFFDSLGLHVTEYKVVDGKLPCCFAIIVK